MLQLGVCSTCLFFVVFFCFNKLLYRVMSSDESHLFVTSVFMVQTTKCIKMYTAYKHFFIICMKYAQPVW